MAKQLTPQLYTLARYQQGAVGRRQVIGAGLSTGAVRRRVRSGDWQRLGRGVYATFTGKSTRETKLWITVLRAGPGAVLSHETAAEYHGFADTPSRQIHITVPAQRRPAQHRPIPGVIIHRSRTVVPAPQPPWRLPCTGIEDTVLDLVAAAKTFDDAYGWICRALGRHATIPLLLREALSRRSRMRWRAWINEALDDADEGINSPLERRYVRGVERAHGLPRAKRQAKRRIGSGNRYVDNLYEGYGVCVELDGAAAHPGEGRWKDTDRDNANIAADDTRTFRFGWVATTEKRCRSAQQVADTLRRNGWLGTPRPCGPGCSVK
jgi:hypothetical protein